MPPPTCQQATCAMFPSSWETTNQVLYELCQQYPNHCENNWQGVIAKVLIIGRSYAAAIERSREMNDTDSNTFYANEVAPNIINSPIDDWINEARNVIPSTPDGLRVMIKVHHLVTQLFHEITGKHQRSLASKYLHFHVPNFFFIYDSRANAAACNFADGLELDRVDTADADASYKKFATRASALVSFCEAEYGLSMSPRQIDNLLLNVNG